MKFALERPIPKMYVRPISTLLFSGRSTPAIRAIWSLSSSLPLSLLVLGNRADDPHDPVAPHDLAFHADSLHRRSDFHDLSLILWRRVAPSGARPPPFFFAHTAPPPAPPRTGSST